MTDAILASVTEQLFAEFEPDLSLSQVTAAVLQALGDLTGSVSKPSLPEMLERLARYRLTEQTAAAQLTADP